MNEVIPGVYRLKVPLPSRDVLLGYVNTYVVRGQQGYLMVDTGWNTDEAFSAVQRQLAEIGTDATQISQIVMTHIHPDHYGLAGRLKDLSNARVYVHRLDADMVRTRYMNMDPLLKQTFDFLVRNGVPPAEATELHKASVTLGTRFVMAVAPDAELEGGEAISTGEFHLNVIWTPGHSRGHICLYEPQKKILFSGDHILPHITPNIGLHPQSGPNPIREFIASLDTVAALDVDLVLPGHEDPFHGVRERIVELKDHHDLRKANIAAQIGTGAMSGYEAARGVPWHTDTGGMSFDKLDPFDQRLAILETLAHLEYMRSLNEVTRSSRNGILVYRRS